MNNILIISYSFPPSSAPAAQRPYYFAKYLSKRNKVHVLIPDNSDSSLGSSFHMDPNKENFRIHKSSNISIKKARELKNYEMVSDTGNYPGNMLSSIKKIVLNFGAKFMYPDKAFTWIPSAVTKAKEIIKNENIDVVYTTSPLFTNHIIGLQCKSNNITWVVDFRDYHYIENFEFVNSFRRFMDKYLEKKILKKCDYALFISKSMLEEYKNRYLFLDTKGHAIYNGLDPEEYKFIDSIPKPPTAKMIIFYAGSFYKGVRDPRPLLEALDFLHHKNQIDLAKIEIKIAGNFDKDLQEEISHLRSYKCIDFLGLIPRNKVLKLAASSHLLWLIVGEKKSHYTGFPIKGFEYIGVKRPILVFTKEFSEPQSIIEGLGVGKRLSNALDEDSIKMNAMVLKSYYDEYLLNNIPKVEYDEVIIKKFLRNYQSEQLEKIVS